MKSFKDALQGRTFDHTQESQAKFLDEQRRKTKIYSQNDLDAAVEKAKIAGMEEGFAKAQQDIAGQTNATLKIISDQFAAIRKDFDHASREAEATAASIALTSLQKLLPHLIKTRGPEEIKHFIENIIREHLNSTVLKVFVNNGIAAKVDEHLTATLHDSALKKSLQVIADPGIAPTACRLEWDKGGYKKDLELQLQQLIKLFDDQGIQGIKVEQEPNAQG